MPAERIGMRDAREIIRLKFSSVSTHEIARRLGMARSTVRETLKRADGAGLSWPLPEGMNDEALEAALYASRRSKRGHRRIEEPDWAGVRRELKGKHVTLLILWDEYIAANPGGYSYSRWRRITEPHILPARPRKPRDKAKVEQAVLIVERWLLGRLSCQNSLRARRRSSTGFYTRVLHLIGPPDGPTKPDGLAKGYARPEERARSPALEERVREWSRPKGRSRSSV